MALSEFLSFFQIARTAPIAANNMINPTIPVFPLPPCDLASAKKNACKIKAMTITKMVTIIFANLLILICC